MNNAESTQGPVQIVLEVADQQSLQDVLQSITALDQQIQTKSISQATLAGQEVTVELDILTEKQRETLELAIKKGYYEKPRAADLTTLAEELEISKSAVSQRLRTAERKLITNALARYL